MTLFEVIATGKPFTCGSAGEFPWFIKMDPKTRFFTDENGEDGWSLNHDDCFRDDWRVREQEVTLTASKFYAACQSYVDEQVADGTFMGEDADVRGPSFWCHRVAKKLGLEE